MPRRAPAPFNRVEDALYAMLENSALAGARNVFVSTVLRRRRYRSLTVIDDGEGIPPKFADLIFEPGVTSRLHHAPPASGLSLYHLKNLATDVRVFSYSSPTSIGATFDLNTTPERSLQSDSRPSTSNLRATVRRFVTSYPHLTAYCGSPSKTLATLIQHRIIHKGQHFAGLEISEKTRKRVEKGEIGPLKPEKSGGEKVRKRRGKTRRQKIIEEWEIRGIEREIAGLVEQRYMRVERIKSEVRDDEIVIRMRVYRPEEEYEW